MNERWHTTGFDADQVSLWLIRVILSARPTLPFCHRKRSRQRMNDHRPGYCCRWPDKQWRQILLDPRDAAPVRLLRSRVIVEDADGRNGVVRRIDHVVGHKAFDVADDWNGTFLDPACQFFDHSGPCFTLPNSGVHGGTSFCPDRNEFETYARWRGYATLNSLAQESRSPFR